MKVTYDSASDVIYIYFDPKKKSTETRQIGEGVNIDYAGKKMIGIEILDASEKLSKKDIENMSSKTSGYPVQIST